jgi:hypothetical protein
MVDAVNTYFDEAFYQLADGFSVENHEFDLERGERGVRITGETGCFREPQGGIQEQINTVRATEYRASCLSKLNLIF